MSYSPQNYDPQNYQGYGNQGVYAVPQMSGPVAHAGVEERATFLRLTYMHLGGAILAFVALLAVLINLPFTPQLVGGMVSGYNWLFVLGAFMLVSWIADRWAHSATSLGMQYAGLALYVVAEAVIFTPLVFLAYLMEQKHNLDIIGPAALITLFIFGGLTAIVMFTGANFSFLRGILFLAGLVAMGVILASILFGFSLGVLFSVLMIALAGGYILYHTSAVLHDYRTDQYVAASLTLFASVAILFWYVLRLVMELQRD